MRITTLNSVVKSLKHFYKLPHNKQDKIPTHDLIIH